jgi:hypothetical protein
MKPITVVMQWEKETKNTQKYATLAKDSPVKEVYVQKTHFEGQVRPQTVKVTVEA